LKKSTKRSPLRGSPGRGSQNSKKAPLPPNTYFGDPAALSAYPLRRRCGLVSLPRRCGSESPCGTLSPKHFFRRRFPPTLSSGACSACTICTGLSRVFGPGVSANPLRRRLKSRVPNDVWGWRRRVPRGAAEQGFLRLPSASRPACGEDGGRGRTAAGQFLFQ
jgi:hypothetical protein